MANEPRFLIVYNDGKWYARHVRIVEHDLDLDEKVYHCDRPIGTSFDTPEEALKAARKEVGHGE